MKKTGDAMYDMPLFPLYLPFENRCITIKPIIQNEMNKEYKRTLITTALPYTNGPVHIGHLAGVYIPADIYARYLRRNGREVLLVGGSDEHGVPIILRHAPRVWTPQDIVDRYHKLIKESFEGLGISFDIYSRTTSDIHHETASEFLPPPLRQG